MDITPNDIVLFSRGGKRVQVQRIKFVLEELGLIKKIDSKYTRNVFAVLHDVLQNKYHVPYIESKGAKGQKYLSYEPNLLNAMLQDYYGTNRNSPIKMNDFLSAVYAKFGALRVEGFKTVDTDNNNHISTVSLPKRELTPMEKASQNLLDNDEIDYARLNRAIEEAVREYNQGLI